MYKDKYVLDFPIPFSTLTERIVVDHRKFRDKEILRTMTIRKLKNLQKRIEEIIKEKEVNKNA